MRGGSWYYRSEQSDASFLTSTHIILQSRHGGGGGGGTSENERGKLVL